MLFAYITKAHSASEGKEAHFSPSLRDRIDLKQSQTSLTFNPFAWVHTKGSCGAPSIASRRALHSASSSWTRLNKNFPVFIYG